MWDCQCGENTPDINVCLKCGDRNNDDESLIEEVNSIIEEELV